MKKAQAVINIILLVLVVIAVVLIVVVLKSHITTTGQVIDEQATKTIKETCVMSKPFICKENSIATNKGVVLFINNEGDEDVLVQKIMLTNCLETAKDLIYNAETKGILISKESYEPITIFCDKELENTFNGNIEITYKVVGSSAESKATGNIIRNVL